MTDLRLMVALARAKQRFPAMRMTQIICNATNQNDPFHVTDEALIKALDQYCATRKGCAPGCRGVVGHSGPCWSGTGWL